MYERSSCNDAFHPSSNNHVAPASAYSDTTPADGRAPPPQIATSPSTGPPAATKSAFISAACSGVATANPPDPSWMIGNTPDACAAAKNGTFRGQIPDVHTGTSTGANRTPDTSKTSPWCSTALPDN